MDFFQCFYQLTKALNGQTFENSWDDNTFSGAETLEQLNFEGNKTKLSFFHSAKCALLYYLGHHRQALDESRIVLNYSDNFVGDIQEVSYAFYTSLSISTCYENLNPDEKKMYLKVFKNHLKDMKMWATGCQENYSQQYYLLLAELFAINNKVEKALQNYEKSIQLAAQNRFKYVEAIANERAALFCSKRQMTRQSQIYLEDAWNAYNNWGAHAKCKQLENTYPELLKVKSVRDNSDAKFGVFTVTSGSSKIALDLASVLKASQSIASQVKYDDLLKQLMYITIENAGAERGCLLLYKGNQLCIEAVGNTGTDEIEIFPSVPIDQMNILPNSILNYCCRSEESVVVNDALSEERFSADPYIQENKSMSIMCLPITSLGKMDGLLYLENSLLKGVFNNNRIELLQMLSGQIGISIQNAILYENLEDKVLERTKEIEKAYTELKATQAQLIQSEKMASLGELTAGIAHEIQNPLNFVNNFSELSKELLNEMKDEITAGNWELATEIADDVIQNLEKINHHGKRADAIVKGMLQHSRTSSGQKEPTDINALANECLQLAYHGLRAKDINFNVTLKTDFDETIGNINIIPQDIGRVILNLITNAFYALQVETQNSASLQQTPPQTKPDYNPTVIVSTKNMGNHVEIRVKDNGSGIPAHIVDKIFQPFFTTKPTGEGTGLGLSLSYDIVKAHGGELKVETKEGEGSEFIVLLIG
jgi:signal transduction histidine kinase